MGGSFAFAARSISRGFEPAVRQFGLQRVVLERISVPEILLPEPDDVELLWLPVVPVPSLVFREKVFVGAGGDCSAHAANVHLGAAVEQVRQILDANPVPDIEASGRVAGLTAFHSEPSLRRSFRAIRAARRGSYRPAFLRHTGSSVRNRGTRNRATDRCRCCPDAAVPRHSTPPSSRE